MKKKELERKVNFLREDLRWWKRLDQAHIKMIQEERRRTEILRQKLVRRSRELGELRRQLRQAMTELAPARAQWAYDASTDDLVVKHLESERDALRAREGLLMRLALVHFTPDEIERELGKAQTPQEVSQ